MASQPYKTPDEVELDLKAFELTERRVALLRQIVLMVISVAFAVVTIICALHGSPWPVSAGLGGSSSVTAAVSALGHRRGK